MPTNDNTNITGLSQLLQGFDDATTVEKEIVNNKREESELGEYRRQMNEIGDSLGIDGELGELLELDPPKEAEQEDDLFGDDGGRDGGGNGGSGGRDGGGRDGGNMGNSSDYSRRSGNDRTPFSGRSRTLNDITEEQKKQSIINSVLSGTEDRTFSVDKEKEDDDKTMMLEQIDMLLDNLKDEGINLSRVPNVNYDSSFDEVEKVLKVLRLKNDRLRYQSFAEEGILAGSGVLEWLFDGKKTYVGRKPDLTGWSATVNMKLRRMRYDTSTFVSDIMQDNNLGHGTRILLELVPSLFLYSKMKKSHSDNIMSSDEVNSAMAKIREMDEKNK